jgi:Tol biopolymer transport system component
MTDINRVDRRLPVLLEELAAPRTPDYLDDLHTQLAAARQRPAWSLPERWIPMADIASRPAVAPRLPWRTIGAAVIIVALLVAIAAVYVGSRQTKVPAPFGPARNGQVAFASNGDIYAGDLLTGLSRPILTGPEMDGNPLFARDGTRIAFMRQVGPVGSGAFNLVIADADGSNVKVLSTAPLDTDNPYEWSPDGSYIVFTDSNFKVTRFDTTGGTAPVVISQNAYIQPGEFRPPDGRQILYEPQPGTAPTGNDKAHQLWVMNPDGTGGHALVQIPTEQQRDGDFGTVRYSPDGTQIAFLRAPDGDTSQLRVFVMNADGTNQHQLDAEPGEWTETDLAWAPDGKHIAFDRWKKTESQEWVIQPIGIASIDGGPVRSVGLAPVSDGASFDYSPDGASLISIPATILQAPYPATNVKPTSIDVKTGQARELDWQVGSSMTWQRLTKPD